MYFFYCLLFFLNITFFFYKNPIHSILILVLIFFLSTCFSIFLGIEFLAYMLMIIYVGAILILFLFVIMMLNVKVIEMDLTLLQYWWIVICYLFFFFLHFSYLWYNIYKNVNFFEFFNVNFFYFYNLYDYTDIECLSEMLFFYYFYIFLFSSLILLVAIVSPIILTVCWFLKKKKDMKNKYLFNMNIFRNPVKKNSYFIFN